MTGHPEPPSAQDLRPLLAEFRNPSDEQRFLQHHLDGLQRQLRISLVVTAGFYTLFAAIDLQDLGSGPEVLTLMRLRLSFVATAALAIWASWRWPGSIQSAWVAASLAELVCVLSFLFAMAYRPQQIAWHAMMFAIMIVVIYLYIPNRLPYAAALALASSAAFVGTAALASPITTEDLRILLFLLLVVNVVCGVAARRYQRLLRQEFHIQSALLNLCVHDPLTGCFNRRHLHDHLLENEISRAQRYGLSITVIMCDLDHFKRINDDHGHFAGDAVLCAFAQLLQSMTRDAIDSVVRYGGEEFLLILPETDIVGGTMLAERLRAAFAQVEIDADGVPVRTTASFGVVTADFGALSHDVTRDQLVSAADRLMYAAKGGGRNQVCAQQIP